MAAAMRCEGKAAVASVAPDPVGSVDPGGLSA
jgi:hypothetical protein